MAMREAKRTNGVFTPISFTTSHAAAMAYIHAFLLYLLRVPYVERLQLRSRGGSKRNNSDGTAASLSAL
jgi:hypothetical protein